jgi:radical SAM protein with 4Fe4S-binding SPASM domain
MPVSISIEPTTSCNLQCPECPSGLRQFSRPTGKIEDKTMDRIIDQLGKYLMYVTFYFQGEPLLHPKFLEYTRQLKNKHIIVGTSTNAHFLTQEKAVEVVKSGLDRLIVSLDGSDAQTYSQYRKGGNFDQVVENIRSMVETRNSMNSKTPFIELQFIVFKHNEHQIADIKKLGEQLGVNQVSIKTAQLYEFEKGNELMPGLVKYSRYEEYMPGKYRIKSQLPNQCYRSWSGNVITWDGGVVPCCFDKDATHRFGNLLTQEYRAIQQDPQYKAFLQQILLDRSQIEICRNCTEGL